MNRRVQSVDALRGLIMIVMALDHVRDFFHSAAQSYQPDDLARTTAAIFFTRWITHFCAPVFMFTAGLGAYFLLHSGRTKAQVSRFLVTRGWWLMFLDVTAVRFAMTLGAGPLIINVLWGLGCAMIVLAALIYLPIPVVGALSVAVIALHNAADSISLPGIHQLGVFEIHGVTVILSYTLIPWFAVMAAGFAFGGTFTQHKRWIAPMGLSLTLAFLLLRTINVYGDPTPWTHGLLSFLRVNKYPPSLDFLLMTLGPALMILAWFDKMQFAPRNPLIVFGRVPLFYFLGHLFVAHALVILLARSWSANPILRQAPPGYGYGLGGVYLIWVAVVATMYPACLWFGGVKQRRRDWRLSYL
jgi:uncharacterized membrane protein